MKVLSVRQPYAYAIVCGAKPVENRTWPTPFRGEVLIHAALREERDDVEAVLHLMAQETPFSPQHFRSGYQLRRGLGCIVGGAVVADCVQQHPSPWFNGPYGFVLRDTWMLREPILCRGALGFFDAPESVLAELKLRVSDGGIVPTGRFVVPA